MAITINGSGTITGISAGGLPDGSVTNADLEYAGISGQFLQSQGTGAAPQWATVSTNNLTRGTSQSLSGNTAVTFSSIPSNVKRVVISVSQYSSTAAAYPRIRLGYNSGTFQTTGYDFLSTYTSSGSTYYPATNVGYFDIYHLNAGSAFYGHIVLTNITGNTWVQSHTGGSYGWSTSHTGGGYVNLLGTLDTIEFSNHTGTMDGGTVNIFYEV